MELRVFGIRHHGPGCARSLRRALEDFAPDCVLLEGPPDADGALGVLGDPGLRPPLALLVHDVEEPRRALFYPFAVFSPEWQALCYASERRVPARFIDLPCSYRLALAAKQEAAEAATERDAGDEDEKKEESDASALHEDPVGLLAEAAGFADREQWWDVQVEQRTDATGLFDAIREAMAELRAHHPERGGADARVEAQREAHMRACIRKARQEGFARVAVVCGAWHAPALTELGGAAEARRDNALLEKLPKVKTASTWIPWTHSRLAFRSGYGAGVDSPGWYAHLWEHAERAPTVWAVRAARLLRSDDLDASSASVIETVRLAETLAVVRELPAPGLTELREATRAVLCGGDDVRVSLIRERLEIGEALGAVPEGAAQVPLQRDFERQVKRLRLKLTPEPATLVLDLRKDTDRERSRFLHRLGLLGLTWGEPVGAGRTTGTFRENWRLAWKPELVVDLIAANLYGNTVATAARAKVRERAEHANVSELAASIERALVADLPELTQDLLAALDARAAQSNDVCLLLAGTEPLARVIRYGDVRGTRVTAIEPVFRALLERAIVGLLPACTQLDDEAAARLLDGIQSAHGACLLIEAPELLADWFDALAGLLDAEAVHPRVRGRACRLLLEQSRLTREDLERRAHLALSRAVDPGVAARWLEGLVAGEGLFLVHHDELVAALDAWLTGLAPDAFQAELPLLRRAFSSLAPAERRALAQKLAAREKPGAARTPTAAVDFDRDRARRALPVLAAVLGVQASPAPSEPR